ncbi:hypothetical protein Hanom_Chr11g00975181 [Helianthus anomalus]
MTSSQLTTINTPPSTKPRTSLKLSTRSKLSFYRLRPSHGFWLFSIEGFLSSESLILIKFDLNWNMFLMY